MWHFQVSSEAASAEERGHAGEELEGTCKQLPEALLLSACSCTV